MSGIKRPSSRVMNRARMPHCAGDEWGSVSDGAWSRTSFTPTMQKSVWRTPDRSGARVVTPRQAGKGTGGTSRGALGVVSAPDGEEVMEQFLSEAMTLSVDAALDATCRKVFKARNVIVWQEVPDMEVLFNQTTGITTPNNQGIIGRVFAERSVMRIADGPSHPAFAQSDEKFCLPNAPVLLFPLLDWHNCITFMVQIVRSVQEPEFSVSDVAMARGFGERFKAMSKWIVPAAEVDGILPDVLKIMSEDEFCAEMLPKVARYFCVRVFEVWKLDETKSEIWRYSKTLEQIDAMDAGIAGDALSRRQTVSCLKSRLHRSYQQATDGGGDEAVFAFPLVKGNDNVVHALVLRGPQKCRLFKTVDAAKVKKLAPFILICLDNMKAIAERERQKSEKDGVGAVMSLGLSQDLQQLAKVVEEKGREFTEAEQCSLFVVNESRDQLVTGLCDGLSEAVSLPIDEGIAGLTVTESKIVNVPDAYELEVFDSAKDQASGSRTKSVLSIPIFSNKGEVVGVTQMINKSTGECFTDADVRVGRMLNAVCGGLLDKT